MKKQLQKFLALILVLCCILGLAQPVAAAPKDLPAEHFQASFVSGSGTAIPGNFLKRGSAVYVELGTLKAMGNDIDACLSESGRSVYIYRTMQTGSTLSPNPDVQSIEFPIDNTLISDQGIYVPFSVTLEALGLNPLVDKKNQQLVIVNAGNIAQLAVVMEEIYQEACYNMRYWKDSENYRRDVGFAEMVGAIRDLSLISFVIGKTTYEGYREAFAKLIMPQDKEDVEFSTGTNETLGTMSTFFSLAEGVADFALDELELDLIGDLKDTYDAVFGLVEGVTTANEVFDVEGQIELIAYFQAAREAEESTIRALKEIMTETPGISDEMDSALKEVMDTYESGDPLWLQVIDKLRSKALGFAENRLKELIPQSYLFDVGNEITNFYIGTGDQVAATAQASRFLDIQTCCQQVFDEVLPSYKIAMGAGKGEFLQIMYDVTNLYLLAGIQAQEAMSQVDGLKGTTEYSINRLKKEQARMAQFSELDIQAYANYDIAENWLASLKKSAAVQQGAPKKLSVSTLSTMPTFVTITWESEVEGRRMDMTANISGTLDDGATIGRGSDGDYIANSELVASNYHYGKWIDLKLLRNDAVMDVVIEYGNVMPFDAPSYAEANVEIHIYNPLGTIAVIAADPEKSAFAGSHYLVDLQYFLLRGGTGVNFFTFQLDHGELKSLHSEYVPDTTPDEYINQKKDRPASDPTEAPELIRKSLIATKSGDRLDEYYTPDGQLQYSERYNTAGYKLEYRWFDNGECTAYTHWTYNSNNHLTRIRYMNVMEPDVVQMDFENTYSGAKLQKVTLYNVAGTKLGEGTTAADAADAVGMRMLVEESLPK